MSRKRFKAGSQTPRADEAAHIGTVKTQMFEAFES
jgi:hypothetical protein